MSATPGRGQPLGGAGGERVQLRPLRVRARQPAPWACSRCVPIRASASGTRASIVASQVARRSCHCSVMPFGIDA